MRETVTIHVGQCGNQIGSRFWDLLVHEHEKTPDNDESLSAFFRFEPSPKTGRPVMKARSVLIDMECGVLEQIMNSQLKSLFDETQFVADVSGSGNNFAQGHYSYGPQYRAKFEESIRNSAEQCDSLQTFLVTHSLGGGTGSGVGTYVLGVLHDLYPKVYRFSTCVYPSEEVSDVITAPYNTMLATSELIDHADCVFPIDNSALFNFCQLEGTYKKQAAQAAQEIHPARDTGMVSQKERKKKDKGFDAVNGIVARMLCHLTASSRFHGEMNVDMNEIYTNLIPFPRMNFLMTALSVRPPISSVVAGSNRVRGARDASSARMQLHRAFQDLLLVRGQITAASPTAKGCITLASAFISRGSVPLSEFLSCVLTAQQSLRFPEWNQDACKIGMCGTPSPGDDCSVLGVYNSSSFSSVLKREMEGFQSLYRSKAYLHHFTNFVEESAISDAQQNVASLIQSYEEIEAGTYVDHSVANAKMDPRLVQLFPSF